MTVTLAKVSSSGKLLDSCVAIDPDNKHRLEFNKGAKVTCTSGKVPRRIEMRLGEESLSAPAGMEIIGQTYELTGYTKDSVPCSVIFDKPAKLTLSYDPGWLPKDTSSILIASRDVDQDWNELELPSGSAAEPGGITALISQTSTFAILARLEPSLTPVPSPPAPPKFRLSELAVNPAQTEVGEPITISTIVQNTGELEGSYTLTLKINGEIEQSKETTLAAGKSTQVSFTVVKDNPGTYVIAVDGLTGEFIVLALASSPTWVSIYWWVVLLAAVIIALMVYFLAIRPRHRP